MDRSTEEQIVDAEELAATIEEVLQLELHDRRAFNEVVARNALRPLTVVTAALRSERVAYKAATAAKFLVEETNNSLRSKRRGSKERRDAEHFRSTVGRELRIYQAISDGVRAKNGQLPNQPNPRRRAEQRLVDENLAGPVPQGRFRELFEEEKARDVERKRAEKESRRQARRQARIEAETPSIR